MWPPSSAPPGHGSDRQAPDDLGHITLVSKQGFFLLFNSREEVAHVGALLRQAGDRRPHPGVVDRVRRSSITSPGWPSAAIAPRPSGAGCPIVVAFGEFARDRGAIAVGDLPAHVEDFVAERVARHDADRVQCGPCWSRRSVARSSRCSRWSSLASSPPAGRTMRSPSPTLSRGFFDYLVDERGLRPASIEQLSTPPRPLRGLSPTGSASSDLAELSPAILSAFRR